MNEGQPFTAADIKAAPVDQPEEKEIINKPEVEKGVAIQNLFASPTSNATISTQETEKITTPYLYYQQPDGNNLYTMSYTDPYLYTYMDNAWYTINKLAWNSKKDTTPIRIKNAAAIAKLNATFEKTAVEPTAPVAPAAIAYKPNEKVRLKFGRINGKNEVYLKWFKNGTFVTPKIKGIEQAFYNTNPTDDLVTFKALSTVDPNYAKIITSDGQQWWVSLKDLKPIK